MSQAPRLGWRRGGFGSAAAPGFTPDAHGCGIVHLGVGAFHRAHQAVYTDDAIADSGGDWRITGVSLRGTAVADALTSQDGLFTVIDRGPAGPAARVIGSLAGVIAASRAPGRPLAALAAPGTRIVTLTVTEKAYGLDRATLAADPAHPAVAADLAAPEQPSGVLGLLVAGLRLRRQRRLAPVTVLCCDNLPDNGALLRGGVVDVAGRTDPGLADWIAAGVAFPSCMVDRITPAATDATRAEALRLTGCRDLAAVETEPFRHWVIEDRFAAGRPAWEAGGAMFVGDVGPYEAMKLRLLNGTHSMLAYAGLLAGRACVRDVMADPGLCAVVDAYMIAAAATLSVPDAAVLDRYRRDLLDRFANPAIAHETRQIAMDGTEKLPHRILDPAGEALAAGADITPFAFAIAAWMRYCLGRTEDGRAYPLCDPREDAIRARLAGAGTAAAISAVLHGLPGLFPARLAASDRWRAAVTALLRGMLDHGMAATIDRLRPALALAPARRAGIA